MDFRFGIELVLVLDREAKVEGNYKSQNSMAKVSGVREKT